MYSITAIQNTGAAMVAPTFDGSFITRWTAYIDASPKTVQTYTRAIKQFAVYMNDNAITAPTREDVIAYRDALDAAGKKPTTVNAYLMAVKVFFQWTETTGLYPNVANRVKEKKIDKDVFFKDYLTEEQAAALLQSIDRTTLSGKRDFAMLSLMLTTGLRTISISRANIEDVGRGVLYYQGKGHASRVQYVKLAPQVAAAISDYLNARGETDTTAALFASTAHRNAGERMTTRAISGIVKNHLKQIGLNNDRLTAHSLRYTAGVLNLKAGGTLEETRDLLGHTSTSITERYTHMVQRERNNSECRIAGAIFA